MQELNDNIKVKTNIINLQCYEERGEFFISIILIQILIKMINYTKKNKNFEKRSVINKLKRFNTEYI